MKGRDIPESSGVYWFKDTSGAIIYVGKALSLKNRLKSYFQGRIEDPKTRMMVEKIADFDFLLTDNELEALLLESSLIKKHRPKFNVVLKDDKSYPFLELTNGEAFPAFKISRGVRNPQSRYFGPFPESRNLRILLGQTRKLFPLRSCSASQFKTAQKQGRPCLNYQLKICPGPCLGKITPEEYRLAAQRLGEFLEGKTEQLKRQLRKEMETEALELNFERCRELKTQLEIIERITAEQKMVMEKPFSGDYLVASQVPGLALVQVLKVREGKLLSQERFPLKGGWQSSPEELLVSFIKQYYRSGVNLPGHVITACVLPEKDLLEAFLEHLAGKKVKIETPKRGLHLKMLKLAEKNAESYLKQQNQSAPVSPERLQEVFGLETPPRRIEIYDLSNLSGAFAVGAMAVFEEGEAAKSQYRKFKIKSLACEIPDDYTMLREVLLRRLKRPWPPADLMLIDGGKGHLNVARLVLKELGLEKPELMSLAKKENHFFRPGREKPLILPTGSPELLFMMRARDEAHRFAIGYNKVLRKKNLTGKSWRNTSPGSRMKEKK